MPISPSARSTFCRASSERLSLTVIKKILPGVKSGDLRPAIEHDRGEADTGNADQRDQQ